MLNAFKIKNLKLRICPRRRGAYLPMILMISTLFIAFAAALSTLAISNLRNASHFEKYISSLEVAEAGVNYYMWHLSHNNTDYCDDTVCTGEPPYGPFIHDYKDQNGNVVGQYKLYVTPPTQGEAVTKVKAVGTAAGSVTDRSVIADLGMPSFARYSFLTNTECWFGPEESVHGPVHSNVGVHFDGTTDSIISASSKTYKPANTFGGDNEMHDGVWGSGGPAGFFSFPVPTVNFNKISLDLLNLNAQASARGINLGPSYASGYYIKLNADDTISVYKVTRERTTGINISFLQTYPAPANGVIYANDNVWIDGTYGKDLTVAAELSGNQPAKIKIKDNLLYKQKDGTVRIGLVSQGNIEVPSYAPTDLEIDGALLSQKGHVWFPQANGYIKNSITIYGSISSYDFWTWSWVNGTTVVSGYRHTTTTFDKYLTLAPPPQFPSIGNFSIFNWREE